MLALEEVGVPGAYETGAVAPLGGHQGRSRHDESE